MALSSSNFPSDSMLKNSMRNLLHRFIAKREVNILEGHENKEDGVIGTIIANQS